MDSYLHPRTFLITDAPWLEPDCFLSQFNPPEINCSLPRLSPVTSTTLRNTKFINNLFTPALFHFN